MEDLSTYEQERLARMQANQARLDELGIRRQATILQQSLCFRAQRLRTPAKAKSCPATPARTSARLAKAAPEFKGLADDFEDRAVAGDGRTVLPKSVAASEQDQRWKAFVSARRCDSKSRGSIYDSVAGICCHFCRQKKLCGEPECERCSARDPALPCRGKSECTRCGSATGRFCRACLSVRYGERLEDVRAAMAAGAWLCPHCYEADHPEEGWICNSSICMTKRGLKPTGIAIFEAQGKGFASVGHYVQAQLLQHRRARGATAPAAAHADAAVTVTVSASAAGCTAALPAGAAAPAAAAAACADAAVTIGVDASAAGCTAPVPAAPANVHADAAVTITVCTRSADCADAPCAGADSGHQAAAQQLSSAEAAAVVSIDAQVEAPKQHSSPARDAAGRDAASEGPPTPRKHPEGLPERYGSEDASEGAVGAMFAGARDPGSAEGSSNGGRPVAHVTPTKRGKACGATRAALASPVPAWAGGAEAAAHATPTKRAKAGCAVLAVQQRITQQRSLAAADDVLPAFAPETAGRVMRSSRRLQS